jgi:hypothetical protein
VVGSGRVILDGEAVESRAALRRDRIPYDLTRLEFIIVQRPPAHLPAEHVKLMFYSGL